MEIKILGCSGGRTPNTDLTSYLIDDSLLVDTGAAATMMALELQESLVDILVTHAHLDHILGIAHIYGNTRDSRVRPLEIYGTEPVLRVVRENLMNKQICSSYHIGEKELPKINYHSIALEIPFRVGSYEVEAFPVSHTPGSVAYRVTDEEHTFFFTGDTGRTDRIWHWLKKNGMVDCLIAEASFPNRMQELADLSAHLSPQTLIESLVKGEVSSDDKVYIVHLKPAFQDELIQELKEETDWNLIPINTGDIIKLEKGKRNPKILNAEIEDKVRNKIPEFDKTSDLYDQRDNLTSNFGISAIKGDIIFHQGDKSRIMYIIQQGKIRIYREVEDMEKTLAILSPGDFFGEMALFNNHPRTATAEVLTDVKLLAFDTAAFENLISNNFGVALMIIRTMAARLQETDMLIENLLYIDPQSKVINTLCRAAYDEGIETTEGFLIRTSPDLLAERSGVIIGTLRGILTNLVEKKLIVARRETIIIPDVQKLRRLIKFLELKDEFD